MSDPLRDPDYPQRPQSQDFWRLSEIVLWMDGKTEDRDFNFEAFLKEAVDPEALMYMAEQRGFRSVLAGFSEGRPNAGPTAAWIDGFLVGYRFFQKEMSEAEEMADIAKELRGSMNQEPHVRAVSEDYAPRRYR